VPISDQLEKAGLATREVKRVERFVDLLSRVFRRHREAYTAGSVRNGRRPNGRCINSVRKQPFRQRRRGGCISHQDRENRTSGLRHVKTELLHPIEQPLPIRPKSRATFGFMLNDGHRSRGSRGGGRWKRRCKHE